MLICVSVEHFSQMFVAVFTISFLFLSNPKSLQQLAQIAILKILSIILKVLTVVCYLFVKYFECANMDSQRGFYTRRVFRTHLNIYDGSISRRQLTAYKEYKEQRRQISQNRSHKKTFLVDIQPGFKYASVHKIQILSLNLVLSSYRRGKK